MEQTANQIKVKQGLVIALSLTTINDWNNRIMSIVVCQKVKAGT